MVYTPPRDPSRAKHSATLPDPLSSTLYNARLHLTSLCFPRLPIPGISVCLVERLIYRYEIYLIHISKILKYFGEIEKA